MLIHPSSLPMEFLKSNTTNNPFFETENNIDSEYTDSSDSETESEVEYHIYGLCTECDVPNTGIDWCQRCNSKRFQQDFPNWTSENKYIDSFIQETQLNAQN